MASAKRFLYLTTPYYAVEEYMQKSLCWRRMPGVDDGPMISAIPDH